MIADTERPLGSKLHSSSILHPPSSAIDSVPELVEVETPGIRWRVTPECRDRLLGKHGFRLQEWLRSGQAVVVKQGPHRAVYHVNLPGLSFYLKHNRVVDFRTWARQLVRPSKAAMEFDRVVAVAGRRIPTVTPLGLGESLHGWGPGDNFLITHGLENTEPLSAFIEQTLLRLEPDRQFQVCRRLARELGVFIARIHDAGILHNDLHAGNILVRLEPDDQPRLFLIDLHAVKIGRPLSWNASRANLVVLSHWFMIQAGRTDRLRFWQSYIAARKNLKIEDGGLRMEDGRRTKMEDGRLWIDRTDLDQSSILDPRSSIFHASVSILHPPSSILALPSVTRDLEKRSWRSTLRLWRAREIRYLTRNRAFEPIAWGVARGHIIRDVDRPALLEMFADPDAPFRRPDVRILKDSPSSTVIEFDMPLSGVSSRVVYKRFRVKSWLDPITAWFRRPAALRSWIFGQGLRECGLPTPRPLAVMFRRRCGLSFEGYLLTEKIENVRELHRFVADLDHLPNSERQHTLRGSVDRVARLVRDLHARRLSHRDLKAANILVRGQGAGGRGQESGVRGQESERSNQLAVISDQSAEDVLGAGNVQQTHVHSPLITHHASRPTHPSSTVWLIDLVGVKRHRWLSRRRRVQNLARLHASFFHSTALTRTDKLRFLRTYLQWGLFGRDGWKRYWREIEIATKAKIARNNRLRRPLGWGREARRNAPNGEMARSGKSAQVKRFPGDRPQRANWKNGILWSGVRGKTRFLRFGPRCGALWSRSA